MAQGPGKYDGECSAIRDATRAKAVFLCVVDGYKGNGFSIWPQVESPHRAMFSKLLHQVADELEKEDKR